LERVAHTHAWAGLMGGRVRAWNWIGRGGQLEGGAELDGHESEKGSRRMLVIEDRLVPRRARSHMTSHYT
jgi:hypothetical protein